MAVTEKQKQDMVANLGKSFELLNTIMELKLSYLKKTNPDKTEAELIKTIHREIIEAKERQWNLQMT